MNEILHDAIWNELALTLEQWIQINESLARNESTYSKSDYDRLKFKITDLSARLDKLPPF